MRPSLFPAALVAALAIAGCNSTPAPAPEPAAYRSPVTPPGFKLPEGGSCAGEAARYRAIMDNDKRAGHVGDKVYDAVTAEIAAAEAACSGGDTGKGIAMIRASKVRHGYPG